MLLSRGSGLGARDSALSDLSVRNACLVLAAWCVVAPAFAQQTRDGRRPLATGTASVAGVVMLDDTQSKPLRRARVMLNGPELMVGRTVITNDDGSFAFDRLPAGRYTVSAVKEGYVTMNYGARRPGRAGTRIVLRDSETTSLTVRIPRGAVITGTITDADGQPASGIAVIAMTHRYLAEVGERRLAPAGTAASITDDRGVYRLFGLPAGDYVVGAQVQVRQVASGSDLQVISAAEVRRALAELRDAGVRAQPGSSNAPRATPPQPVEPPRSVTLAPVLYPGTADVARAAIVKLAAGAERSGVDFQIQYVPTATVGGIVAIPGGGQTLSVTLTRSSPILGGENLRAVRTDSDGRFTFRGIAPGQYTVTARSLSLFRSDTPPPIGPAAAPTLWAATEIIVDGEDVTNIALTLQPGLTVSGRIAFEGTRPPPPDLSRLRVPLPAGFSVSGGMMTLPPVQLDTAGRFTIAGIIPGLYRFGSRLQGLQSSIGGWWLKSIVVNGRDVLESPLELRQSADDAVVTFSDRATELIGTVTDSGGNPASYQFVVVFSTDQRSWFFGSHRVTGVRPDADGRYTIRNLPPGEYLVSAFDDLEQGEWYDASVLQRLTGGAARITIGEYEKKTHDIVVR